LVADDITTSLFDDTTLNGVEPGTIYYYWIKACNVSGCSDFSSSDSGWIHTDNLIAPLGVQASDGLFNDRVRISWNGVGGASFYKVVRNTTNSTTGATVLSSDTLASPFDDLTALHNTEYYYWVQACKNSGCSEFSVVDIGYLKDNYEIFLPILMKNYESDPDPILNGDFENGSDGSWSEYSSFYNSILIYDDIEPILAHGGNWYTWFGGGNGGTWRLAQDVTISSGRPYLHIWILVESEDERCGEDYFVLKLDSNPHAYFDLCKTTNTGGWVQLETDLSPYSGKTVNMIFEVITDTSYVSIIIMDDVSMSKTSFLTDSAGLSTDEMGNKLFLVKKEISN
jgi:hypothetical protein